MNQVATSPFFSVIIPTRNRPELFSLTVESVLRQDFTDYELIAVVDGSDQNCLQSYREIESRHPQITFHFLVHRQSGHGQSYSMNFGASLSTGRYLCFVDDDDYWTDMTYLSGVCSNICACDEPVDIHYSNQRAYYTDGKPNNDDVWLDDRVDQVEERWRVNPDCYRVSEEFLMDSKGFAHLNCSVFRREFFFGIGGMDESIRYENDRDVFIRTMDAAQAILYNTRYVSHHNIPDASRKENLSTESSALEKKLYQIRVYDKAICLGEKPCIIDACRRAKIYELKHVTSLLAARGRHTGAAHYAREACLGGFNLRWMGYAFYLSLLALLRPKRKA